MTDTLISVVCVSRGRPASLCRTVLGLTQLYAPCFEIVVVADADGVSALQDQTYFDQIKVVPFDEANISQARNLGIAQAAGEVIAFIDDDAVPEPTWLDRLVAPILDDQADASGGYVLGRNGISFQWKGRLVDKSGATRDHAPNDPVADGWAVKTEGTNMAVRAKTLRALGGFDPAYTFYLDETDLNLRLAAAGMRVMLIPDALVHHGFASSGQRRADRAPRTLFDIARSTAIFARRHGGDMRQMLKTVQSEQRRRVLRHLQSGALDPWAAGRVFATFRRGAEAGRKLPLRTLKPMPDPNAAPLVFSTQPGDMTWEAVRGLRPKRALEHITDQGSNKRTTLFCFSRTTLRHRVEFHPSGVWCHIGGLYGPSDRSQRWFKSATFSGRVEAEKKRVLWFRSNA